MSVKQAARGLQVMSDRDKLLYESYPYFPISHYLIFRAPFKLHYKYVFLSQWECIIAFVMVLLPGSEPQL